MYDVWTQNRLKRAATTLSNILRQGAMLFADSSTCAKTPKTHVCTHKVATKKYCKCGPLPYPLGARVERVALQRTATHCVALRCTATHCNALQRTATHCNALQSTAPHCTVPHCRDGESVKLSNALPLSLQLTMCMSVSGPDEVRGWVVRKGFTAPQVWLDYQTTHLSSYIYI